MPEKVSSENHTHAYFADTTATCTQAGKTTYRCLVCGITEAPVDTPAFGHDMSNEEAYSATCTEQGKTAGRDCDRCGYVEIKQETIAALGHSYKNGFCERCHAVQTIDNVIAQMNFTTSNVDDYIEYGRFFKAHGSCDLSTDKKYLVMKSIIVSGENVTPVEYSHPHIEFTVDRTVTLIVVASSTDRGNTSRFTLMDSNDNIVAEKFGETSVEGVSGETLVYNITQPGTYRFLCTETNRVGRLMSVILVSGTK